MRPVSEDVRYGKSPVTGNWYKVTEWEEVDGHSDRIIADEKVEIDESEVPENVLKAHEEMGQNAGGGGE